MPIKSFHNTKLGELEMEAVFADIVKFLKKEYKNVNGRNTILNPDGSL